MLISYCFLLFQILVHAIKKKTAEINAKQVEIEIATTEAAVEHSENACIKKLFTFI